MRPIAILGMHRSGTSMVTRIAGLLGVDLGKDLQTRPMPGNSAGQYEHVGIRSINEVILNKLGTGGWWDPPREPFVYEGEWPSLEREALEVLGDFKGPIYAFKDPRTCLTITFWKLLIPNLDYIICLRNPRDIAASLHCRDNTTIEYGLDLYDIYNTYIKGNTWNSTRHIINTPELVESPEEHIRDLAHFLNIPSTEEQIQSAIGSINPTLWHHRTKEGVVAQTI